MAGTIDPQGGLQGFWAQFRQLSARISSLEAWQRQISGSSVGGRDELEARVAQLEKQLRDQG